MDTLKAGASASKVGESNVTQDLNAGGLSLDAWFFLVAISGYMLVHTPFSTTIGLGGLVILFMMYLALDAAGRHWASWRSMVFRLKLLVIFITVSLLLLVPAAEQIACRQAKGAYLCAHDGLIQTEEAVRMLLQGKNPYTENYFGTPLEKAPFPRSPSPALYHLAYLPFTFLVHVPFADLIWQGGGWYDGRVLYVAMLLLSLLLCVGMAVRDERRLALVIALGLNLPLLDFTAEGRNDIVGLCLVLLSLYLAARNRRTLSMVVMGLGCASKQTIWFILPFYALYLVRGDLSFRSLRQLAFQAWPLYLTIALIIGPFLIWDARAFVEDTVFYLTGQTAHSYPLWGMGFGMLLRVLGVVGTENDYVPFWIPQLIVGVPVLGLFLVYQWRHNEMRVVWLGFATLQLVLGYFSRIFQANYLAVIVSIFSFAFLVEERQTAIVGAESE